LLTNTALTTTSGLSPAIGGVASVQLSGHVTLTSHLRSNLSAIDAAAVDLAGATLTAATDGKRIFVTPPRISGPSGLVLLYRNRTTGDEPLSTAGRPILQLGSVSLPSEGPWTLSAESGGDRRSFAFDASQFASFLVSVHAEGSYRLNAVAGDRKGHLERAEGEGDFPVSGFAFFADGHFVADASESAQKRLFLIIGSVGAGLLLVALIVLIVCLYRRRRAKGSEPVQLLSTAAIGSYTSE
jgi:hypothetical protein